MANICVGTSNDFADTLGLCQSA